MDGVEERIRVRPLGLGPRVAHEVAPVRRDASDDAGSEPRGERLVEVAHDRVDLCGRGPDVREAETPDLDERAAVVVEVRRAARHVQVVYEMAPIASDDGPDRLGVLPAHVPGDRDLAAMASGALQQVDEHEVAIRRERGVRERRRETLVEDAVDSVLLHPLDVALYVAGFAEE